MQNDFLLSPIPLETIEQKFSNIIDQKFNAFLAVLQQTQTPSTQKYLTRKETSQKLGVSLPTLHEWTKSGLVQGYRIASRVRYKEDEVTAALTQIKTRRNAA